MALTPQALKEQLRAKIRADLALLSDDYRHKASQQAGVLLMRQKAWREASSVLFYAPLGKELDLWPVLETGLKEGKTVALPRYDSGTGEYIARRIRYLDIDLEPGRYGIREPKSGCDPVLLKLLDLILVPGVAFDLHGGRLGRGKGFYDRLLTAVRGETCGVAFDKQVIRKVPVEPHDSDVNCILTPTRWIEL
jgi:5-formyltetrahydrofolate cyclo-ligase